MSRTRVLLGTAISVLFIVLLLRQVDANELGDAFAEARPGWLVAGFAIYLGALALRGVRWQRVLQRAAPLSAVDATALVVIGYAANNVLPVRAGELVRAQLLHDRHRVDRLTALGTIVVERVLDGVVLALFLAGTVALAGGNDTLRWFALIAALGFLALALVLIALGPVVRRYPRQVQRLLRLAPSRLHERAEAWLERLLSGMTSLRRPGEWGVVLALTAASWGVEAAMYWLVGIGLGLDLDPLLYLGVCGAANLAIAVPSTAGGIGPFEFFAREVVVASGVGVAAGTAYAIVLHALLLFPVVLIGVVLIWQRHIAVRGVLERAAHAEDDEAPSPANAATAPAHERLRRTG